MLIDTDVVIRHLRGNAHANRSIQNASSRAISAITYMEVVQGLRNKKEARHWQGFLKNLDVQIMPIEERVSTKAMFWMDEFSLNHALQIPDALIAATAKINGLSSIQKFTKFVRPSLKVAAVLQKRYYRK